jgi:hypothetical protein
MDDTRDWVSRLLEMILVKGTLDYRCLARSGFRNRGIGAFLAEIASENHMTRRKPN